MTMVILGMRVWFILLQTVTNTNCFMVYTNTYTHLILANEKCNNYKNRYFNILGQINNIKSISISSEKFCAH